MINNCYDHNVDKLYKFIEDGYPTCASNNTYTAIIGKNGTGKSLLLRRLIMSFFDSDFLGENNKNYRESTFFGDSTTNDIIVGFNNKPTQVIAISTSPFDKFPTFAEYPRNYSYLGLKGLKSTDLGLSYMGKIIAELLQSLLSSPERFSALTSILSYLGYSEEIVVNLSLPNIKGRSIGRDDSLYSTDPFVAFSELKLHFDMAQRPVNTNYFFRDDGSLITDRVTECTSFLNNNIRFTNRNALTVSIQNGTISVGHDANSLGLDFDNSELFGLISSGLLLVREINLKKSGLDTHYSIKSASSGEQSIVISFLGIASRIRDNSLILIDEPEICLHPEWQERYIELLRQTFSDYTGCHFIIATHSPQIISNLNGDSCFIMNMADGQCLNAKRFANRSADYQLASLFKSPGNNNEYLSRIALNTYVKVSKHKCFDRDDLLNLEVLNEMFPLLNKEQALSDLISTINKLREIHGSD